MTFCSACRVEHYDEGSIIVKDADFFGINRYKNFIEVKRSDYGKGSNNIDERVIRYLSGSCYISGEKLICFFSSVFFVCLRDEVDYDKVPNKEGFIDFLT